MLGLNFFCAFLGILFAKNYGMYHSPSVRYAIGTVDKKQWEIWCDISFRQMNVTFEFDHGQTNKQTFVHLFCFVKYASVARENL